MCGKFSMDHCMHLSSPQFFLFGWVLFVFCFGFVEFGILLLLLFVFLGFIWIWGVFLREEQAEKKIRGFKRSLEGLNKVSGR